MPTGTAAAANAIELRIRPVASIADTIPVG
jgi:hypothetical protein